MPLRFFLDYRELDRVYGWIDDDGPVASLDFELNGQRIATVVPNVHRPDVQAAGVGDGKRGFVVPLVEHFRFIRLDGNRLTIKRDKTVLFDGPLGSTINLLGGLITRLARAEADLANFETELLREEQRVEAALFHAEGLGPLRDAFLAAKTTAEYQAVYDRTNPLVSVCVTTMNRAQLLVERALGSLRAQTYANLQIVVVGDHCTDDTAERVAALKDSRISFENLPKRGPYPRPGTARWHVAGTYPANRALELVQGDFITHLDEDDTFEPHRIEILLKKIQESRADLVFHPFWLQQPDGSWRTFGNGVFRQGHTGTGMVFYHRYLARVPWDLYAYRFGEPGDWNRFRKMKAMRAQLEFVAEPLTRYYGLPVREPFVAQDGEEFLE